MRVDVEEPPDDSVTLTGLTDAVKPEGETDGAIDTVPEKALMLASVIVEVPDEPDCNVRLDGVLEMVKSGLAD